MQFKRNRRLMLAQDIILVCLLPVLAFLCLGSLQIGKWYTGDMFSVTPSTEIMEECLEDFYSHYICSEGNELGETISYSPWSFWKDAGRGLWALGKGILHHTIDTSNLGDMPTDVFVEAAPFLFSFHLVWSLFQSTVFEGLIYFALLGLNATIPFFCISHALYGLVGLLGHLQDPQERHKRVVLSYRRAFRPFFSVLLLTLMLPDVRLSNAWLYGVGLYLISVIWNFVASRIKRNTANEKEFLNFIQFTSLGGIVFAIGNLIALVQSGLLNLIYDRIYYADGVVILLDAYAGKFNSSRIIYLLVTALFLAGIGLVVRYVYYSLLKVSCLLVSSKHPKDYHESQIGISAASLGTLASAFLLTESSGRMEITLDKSSLIPYCVSLGLILMVLIVEIVQRILCSLNLLDREYRNDLLAGCTGDRFYNIEAAIAPPIEKTSGEDIPVEVLPSEETTTENTSKENIPIEVLSSEEATAEGTSEEE